MTDASAEPLAVTAFLSQLSVEITPRQADKIPLLREKLPQGTRVFVALIDPADSDKQREAVSGLRGAGFEPVPHVPARFIRNRDELARRLDAFASEAKVAQALVLGGGAPQPLGDYDAALQLLETGLFEANGITRIGLAGHPEGNPDIIKARGEAMLMTALRAKQAYLAEKGLQGFIATQFLFEAAPVAYWAKALRDEGINLPIHVGVPGPATIKTLVKYAAMCGVGNSARFIRKQALNVTKLLTVSNPDGFIEGLAKLHRERPELNIAGPHLYPFGGFDKLFDWLGPRLR